MDTEVDTRLDKIGTGQARRCAARPAIANARLAYQRYEECSPPAVGRAGRRRAQPQRPLWASTGVKDPAYPDTMYVTELVAAGTVNTMPETTLAAVADHGEVRGDTIGGTYDAGPQCSPASGRRRPERRVLQSWRPRASTNSRSPGRNSSTPSRASWTPLTARKRTGTKS